MYQEIRGFFNEPSRTRTAASCKAELHKIYTTNPGDYASSTHSNAPIDESIESKPAKVEPLDMIGNYRKSKAFKTLLRRQSQAVARIDRIKESFTKKRLQIHMLAVKDSDNSQPLAELRQVHQEGVPVKKELTPVRRKKAEAEPDFPMIGLEGSSKFQTVGLYKASADLNSYL